MLFRKKNLTPFFVTFGFLNLKKLAVLIVDPPAKILIKRPYSFKLRRPNRQTPCTLDEIIMFGRKHSGKHYFNKFGKDVFFLTRCVSDFKKESKELADFFPLLVKFPLSGL